MDKKDLPYRPCVGIMLLNKDNQVFVARRIDTKSEAWQMPQGGVDEGENVETTMYRELMEEIGTNNVEVITHTQDWLSYDLPDHLIGQLWKGKYRGQKQQWFLCRFLGEDTDINLETEHPEFFDWKWASHHKLIDMIVPFKRDLYQQVITSFSEFLPE